MEKGIVMKNGNLIGILLEILETRNGNFLVSCLEYDREFPRFFYFEKMSTVLVEFYSSIRLFIKLKRHSDDGFMSRNFCPVHFNRTKSVSKIKN